MAHPAALIGVSASVLHADPQRRLYNGRPLLYLEQSMATWLMQAGVRPYVIPFAPAGVETRVGLRDLVEGLDGVVLQGGVDMAPQSYGQDEMAKSWPGDPVRDAYEIELVHACLEFDKPLLGICRGQQVINVALGGTLFQDVPSQVDQALTHTDRALYEQNKHRITITPDSWLSQIFGGATTGMVNSVHHQAVDQLGEGLSIQARAVPDGVVEAVRLDGEERWVTGLQWHPEFQSGEDDELLDRHAVLEDFIEAVERRRS